MRTCFCGATLEIDLSVRHEFDRSLVRAYCPRCGRHRFVSKSSSRPDDTKWNTYLIRSRMWKDEQ